MPVDITPIALPIIVFYVVIFVWLILSWSEGRQTTERIRWQRIGWGFLAASALLLCVFHFSTGVTRTFDEPMTYKLREFGMAGTVHFHRSLQFTSRQGDSFSWNATQDFFPQMAEGSAQFFDRIKLTRPETIRVSVTATYDFGKLRAYHINRISDAVP